MSNAVIETAQYTRVTGSIAVRSASTKVLGIFVASSTSGTIKVWDSPSASGDVFINTFSVLPGSFYPMPGALAKGCFVEIGGTVDCTVFTDPF